MTLRSNSSRLFTITLGALGDALMTISVADDALVSSSVQHVTILTTRAVPLIAKLAASNARIDVRRFSLGSIFAASLHGERVAVCFPPTFGHLPRHLKWGAWLAGLVPGVRVFGFADKGAWRPYDLTLDFDPNLPFIKNLAHLCSKATGSTVSSKPHAVFEPISPELSGPYILVHPFAANLKRSLPPRRWRTLVSALRVSHPAYRIVVSASAEERQLAEMWFTGIPDLQYLFDRPVDELAGYIRHADVYVGVDTGVTHLAGVFEAPSVVIGNLSNPTWLPRYNKNAIILANPERCTCGGDKSGDCTIFEDGKPYYKCMYDITDKEIQDAVRMKLSQH